MTAVFKSLQPDIDTMGPLVLALPKGRILEECEPLLTAAGIFPDTDYADESSRRLRFPTQDPNLDVVRVSPPSWRSAARRWASAGLTC